MKSSFEKILVISCIIIASLTLASCGKKDAASTSGNTVTIVGSGSSN